MNFVKPALALILMLPLTGCLEMAFDAAYWTKEKGEKLYDRTYWESKAEKGDAEGQYRMGQYYCCGPRPKYDELQALNWFCKAARQNQRDALLQVGHMYEHANKTEASIIPKDDVMAYVFYTKAVEHDKIGAKAAQDRIFLTLDEEEKAKAQALLDRWPNVGCGTLAPQNLAPKQVEVKSSDSVKAVQIIDGDIRNTVEIEQEPLPLLELKQPAAPLVPVVPKALPEAKKPGAALPVPKDRPGKDKKAAKKPAKKKPVKKKTPDKAVVVPDVQAIETKLEGKKDMRLDGSQKVEPYPPTTPAKSTSNNAARANNPVPAVAPTPSADADNPVAATPNLDNKPRPAAQGTTP